MWAKGFFGSDVYISFFLLNELNQKSRLLHSREMQSRD